MVDHDTSAKNNGKAHAGRGNESRHGKTEVRECIENNTQNGSAEHKERHKKTWLTFLSLSSACLSSACSSSASLSSACLSSVSLSSVSLRNVCQVLAKVVLYVQQTPYGVCYYFIMF